MTRISNLWVALATLLTSGTVAVAQENINCGYPLNQHQMTYCAEKGWQEADAELNAVYKKAIATARQVDSHLPDSLKGAEKSLKDAQRAWIPFRDKSCEAYGFQARGGTMEPMLVYGCLATTTQHRVEELKEFVGVLGN